MIALVAHGVVDGQYGLVLKQLRAFARVADGAVFFGVSMLLIGLLVSLADRDRSAWVSISSALVDALLAATLWYVVARFRARHHNTN